LYFDAIVFQRMVRIVCWNFHFHFVELIIGEERIETDLRHIHLNKHREVLWDPSHWLWHSAQCLPRLKIVAALSGALLVTIHPMKTTAEEIVGDIHYKTVVEDFLICDFAKHSYSAPLGESILLWIYPPMIATWWFSCCLRSPWLPLISHLALPWTGTDTYCTF